MIRTIIAIAVGVALVALAATGRTDHPASAGKTAGKGELERGRYLVESVGMCQDCHTPRGPDGAFVKERWLLGSEVEFTPIHPIPGWATVAPAIAGLASYTDEEAVKLLETGMAPGDRSLAPPMPQFRLHHDDAVAVVAYLRSLEVH